jgi:hypothetical protein
MTGRNLKLLDHIAGNTIIRFTDIDPACLDVDAVVEEQDTNMVLGRSPVIMDTVESFPELVERMEQQTRAIPGKVIFKPATPKLLIAVVYDTEHSPICETAWVEAALLDIIEKCKSFGISTLAMPLLGTTYGHLQQETFIQLLQNVLMQNRQESLKKVLIYNLQDTSA